MAALDKGLDAPRSDTNAADGQQGTLLIYTLGGGLHPAGPGCGPSGPRQNRA